MLIGWWLQWKTTGAPPFSGTWADQPAYVAEAFAAADAELHAISEERRQAADEGGALMSRDVKVGVTLMANIAALTKIQRAVTGLWGGIRKVNDVARFMERTLRMASRAFDATIGKALEVTTAGRQWEKFAKSWEELRISIGTLFTPILEGLAQVLGPVIDNFVTMVNAERNVVAVDIIKWATDGARTLTTVFATAVKTVAVVLTRMYQGLLVIQDVWNMFTGGGNAEAARLASQFALAEQSLKDLDTSLLGGIDTVNSYINKIEELQLKAAGVKPIRTDGEEAKQYDLADAHVREHYRYIAEQAKDGLGKASQELSAYLQDERAKLDHATANAELRDKVEQKQFEEKKKRLSGIAAAAGDIVRTVGGAFSGMMNDILDNTKSTGEIILGFFSTIGRSLISMLIDAGVQAGVTAITTAIMGKVSALGVIGAHAAEAAAGAYAATAAIPFVGPLLAPGVAAQAYASTLAWGASVPLAEGGLVRGGIPGIDSVPARMMPGEYVIPAAQVRANVAAGRAPDDSGSSGGGGNVTLVVQNQQLMPVSQADIQRQAERQVYPTLMRGLKTRALKLRTR